MGYFDGVKSFVLESNFVELAVSFILGLSFKDLIYALISDWITPLFAAIGGQPDFNELSFSLNNSEFFYGHFINVLISTLLLVIVVYSAAIYPLQKYKNSISSPQVDCNMCKSSNHHEAIKCKCCGCDLPVLEVVEK